MIKTLLQNPFGKISVDWIQPAKNWYKELTTEIPDIEYQTSISTLDEYITTDTTFEGSEIKKTYILKAVIDGNRFNYKHKLTKDDNLDEIKANALKQYDAWKFNINENKFKTIDNGY